MLILQKIKELRKKKGISQKNMADKLNISISGYGKIELGENVLSIERFLEICKILDVKSYNEILPEINTDVITEVEKVLIAGSMSFENIHRNTVYVSKLVENLKESLLIPKKTDVSGLVKELEFIEDYLKIIGNESVKHGYNFRSIKDLIEKID